MANVDSAHGFIVEGSFIAGAGIPQWKGRVLAGQTIAIGDPISFSAGGCRVSTAGDAVAGISVDPCASLAAGTEIEYVPAFPWIVFSAQTSGVFSNGNIMSLSDIEGSTGIFEVNEDSNTYGTVRVIARKDVGNTSIGTWAEVLLVFQRTQIGSFYYTTPTI
jgi:hypothetical protein